MLVCHALSLKRFRMAVSHLVQIPLVHSLATLLRNDGMFQCDSQTLTGPPSAVRDPLGSGVTKVVSSWFYSTGLRHPCSIWPHITPGGLCASGCSRYDQRVLGQGELQTVNTSSLGTADVVFLFTRVLLRDVWSNMESSDLHKGAVDKILRCGLGADVPVIPLKDKGTPANISTFSHPFPTITSAIWLSLWNNVSTPCSEFIRVIVLVRDHLRVTFFTCMMSFPHTLVHQMWRESFFFFVKSPES